MVLEVSFPWVFSLKIVQRFCWTLSWIRMRITLLKWGWNEEMEIRKGHQVWEVNLNRVRYCRFYMDAALPVLSGPL